MPRFSERERTNIAERLIDEGERLFLAEGLKNVTIDALAQAAAIAKATFYKFYPCKEALFPDIAQKRQAALFAALTAVCDLDLPDKDKVRSVFAAMSGQLRQYPILKCIDRETAELVRRKVAPERMAEFLAQGCDAVSLMADRGIRFRYPPEVVSKIFLSLYAAWIGLAGEDPAMQKAVIDVLLEGVLDRIL